MPPVGKSGIHKTHPLYDLFAPVYDFTLLSYEGGPEYLSTKTLFKHAREVDDDYERRLRVAFYPNYVRAIADIYLSYLFGTEEGITREVEDPAYESWSLNADIRGNSVNAFMRDAATDAFLYGWTLLGVDMPTFDDSYTIAQVRDSGEFPYLCNISPDRVTHWALDPYGNFLWVRYKEPTPEVSDPSLLDTAPIRKTTEAQRADERYKTWTRFDWKLQDGNGLILAEGAHPLGSVPFVPCYYQKSRKYALVGTGILYDIARVNRAIVNVYSYIDELLAKGAFPVLTRPIDPSAPTNAGDIKVLSQNNFIEYAPGSSAPTYLSPPTNVADYMKTYISEMLRGEIYRIAKLDHREADVAESGVAKLAEFHSANNALADFADNLETAETKLMRLWSQWLETDFEGVIDYPENFSVQPVNDALEQALQIRGLFGDASPTFVADYLYRLSTRLLPKMEEDEKTRLYDELVGNLTGIVQGGLFGARLNEEIRVPDGGLNVPVEETESTVV